MAIAATATPPPKASSATSPSSPTLIVPTTAWAIRSGAIAVLPPAWWPSIRSTTASEYGKPGGKYAVGPREPPAPERGPEPVW